MYFAIAGIVFFATVAMMVQTGLWNNLIKTMAIVVGGLTAFGAFQPIVVRIDEATEGSYTYLLDPLVIAGVFALVCGLIEALAQLLSKNRVAFPEALDKFGGIAVGLVAAYLMCGIVMALLHTAPLSYDAFSEKFVLGEDPQEVKAEIESATGLMRPDLVWLGFAESVLNSSRFGGSAEKDASGERAYLPFSAALYVHNYAQHRRVFESIDSSIVKRS